MYLCVLCGSQNKHNIRRLQIDKSAIAEHSFNNSRKIQFQDTAILSTKSEYLERLIAEAIEVDLHPNNINGEEGLTLSSSWRPILRHLKEE